MILPPQFPNSPVAQNLSGDSARISDQTRFAVAQRATWVSAGVNVLLTIAQLAVGWLAHSQSLIAHGLHSFSDLLSDFLVLFANRQGSHPADDAHPYGHGRMETAATLLLGGSLAGIGAGILWNAGLRLQDVAHLPSIALPALWVAIFTVVAKEGLYRYLVDIARRLRSRLLVANALHTRADAASALVVVAGVGGALAGWPWLDLLAAAIMGFMVLHLGVKLGWEALQELIDTGLAAEEVESIRRCLGTTPGVVDLHELRTRRMAHRALVDAHVRVDPRISVSEGHRIAEQARARVLRAHPDVLDVLVHVDPEDDSTPAGRASAGLPDRAILEAEIARLLGPGLRQCAPPTLHYLGSHVDAEVFLAIDQIGDADACAALERRIGKAVEGHPVLGAISIQGRVAPK
ncbi:MAG: cation diffusion facilitator family transporter [Candidatus Methylophosphatis roskildensis]